MIDKIPSRKIYIYIFFFLSFFMLVRSNVDGFAEKEREDGMATGYGKITI